MSDSAQTSSLTLSRADAVTRVVRDEIIDGVMPPGLRLNLDDLAKRFGVSRMPIREALKQLAAEGFVTSYPYRGMEVARLSAADVEELYGMRGLLERLAVERAATRIDEAALAQMHDLLERMDAAVASSDGPSWYKLNEDFHRILNRACGWPRMVEMIEILRQNIGRYVRAYTSRTGFDGPQRQHWALYRACVDHDETTAGEIIAAHLQNTADLVVRTLEQRRDEAIDPDEQGADRQDANKG